MAKSFKQLPSPRRSAPAIPLSEMDFFALQESAVIAESVGLMATAKPIPVADPFPDSAREHPGQENQAAGNTGNSVSTRNPVNPDKSSKSLLTGNRTPRKRVSVANNIGNTSKTDNAGISDNGDKSGNSLNPPVLVSPLISRPATDEGGVRQTFVLGRGHLEQLRDYVHARRAGGDYNYSQKQALQQALDMLFSTAGPANPRPSQAREREEQHRERIRQGRQARNGHD
jgi:hypothetical protein